MLQTNQSHKRNAWKYATILPVLVSFMLLFQIETIAQTKIVVNSKVVGHYTEVESDNLITSKTTDDEIKPRNRCRDNCAQGLFIEFD